MKDSRINIRLDEQVYDTISKAANYQKTSLSDFIRHASLKLASKIIKENEKMNLTNEDWGLFFDALENKPNAKLKEAFNDYNKIVK